MSTNQDPDAFNILLFGDEDAVQPYRSAFTKSVNTVLVESSIVDVLKEISQGQLDCVILIQDYSEGSRIEDALRIRAQHPDVPLIISLRPETVPELDIEAVAPVRTHFETGDPAEDTSRLLDSITKLTSSPSPTCRESDEYQTLIEHFPNGLVTRFDQEYRYTVVGGTGFENLDISVEDIEGKQPSDVFPDENVEVIEPLYERALNGTESIQEVELQGRIFRVHVLPVRDDTGTVIGGMTVSQDVTEQREREGRLRRYETVVEALDDGISWIDEAKRFTFVNQSLCSLIDRPRSEILGNPIREVLRAAEGFSDQVVDDISTAIDRVLAGHVEESRVEVMVTAGSERQYREIRFVPLIDDADVVGAIGLNRDITGIKAREEALKASERKYKGLVETAPDAIFLADAETGRLLEANEAAGELIGRSPSEIAGMHQSELHPPEDSEAYRKLFQQHVDSGGTTRRLPDGRQTVTIDRHGRRTPVAISAASVEIDGHRIIHGIFRDISDQIWYETSLTALTEIARDLAYTRTDKQVFNRVVSAITELTTDRFARCYKFDKMKGCLLPTASTDNFNESEDSISPIKPGESPLWEAFNREETVYIPAKEDQAEFSHPGDTHSINTGVAIPLANHGILFVSGTPSEPIRSVEIELFEILAMDAEKALTRTERERNLAKRNHELERQEHRIEQLSKAVDGYRTVSEGIDAPTGPKELFSRFCDSMVDQNIVDGAWVTTSDSSSQRVQPDIVAGNIQSYLDTITPLSVQHSLEPTAVAIQTGNPVSISNTAHNIKEETWRQAALEAGHRSVYSVPITTSDIIYGTVSVYADEPEAFDTETKALIHEGVDLLAQKLESIYRKSALIARHTTQCRLVFEDPLPPLLKLFKILGDPRRITQIRPFSSDGETITLQCGTLDEESLDDILTRIDSIPDIIDVDPTDDHSHLDITLSRSSIVTRLANTGISVRDVSVERNTGTIIVDIPPLMEISTAMTVIHQCCPTADLEAKRNVSLHDGTGYRCGHQERSSDLTDRQWEAIELAFNRGYFESPKGATGTQLAGEMGISATAFHDHLRAAERKLLSGLIRTDDESNPTKLAE